MPNRLTRTAAFTLLIGAALAATACGGKKAATNTAVSTNTSNMSSAGPLPDASTTESMTNTGVTATPPATGAGSATTATTTTNSSASTSRGGATANSSRTTAPPSDNDTGGDTPTMRGGSGNTSQNVSGM